MRSVKLLGSLSGLFLLAMPAITVAQQYTSSDVAEFFSKQMALGASRGICVGTEQECAKQQAPAAYNMRVTFELNSDQLTEEATANLAQIAKALEGTPLQDAKFVVEGHTDAWGSESYNDQLSEKRAKRVAEFLVANGVAADRLTSLGVGKAAPLVSDPYDPANRRVEMKLAPKN